MSHIGVRDSSDHLYQSLTHTHMFQFQAIPSHWECIQPTFSRQTDQPYRFGCELAGSLRNLQDDSQRGCSPRRSTSLSHHDHPHQIPPAMTSNITKQLEQDTRLEQELRMYNTRLGQHLYMCTPLCQKKIRMSAADHPHQILPAII
jgi:hypothetical protein